MKENSEKKHFIIIFCFSLFLNCSHFRFFSSPPSPSPPPPPLPLPFPSSYSISSSSFLLLLLPHATSISSSSFLLLLLPHATSTSSSSSSTFSSSLCLLYLCLLFTSFPPSFLIIWLYILTLPIFIPFWKFCRKTPESLCNPSNLIRLGQLSLFSCAASALTWGPW